MLYASLPWFTDFNPYRVPNTQQSRHRLVIRYSKNIDEIGGIDADFHFFFSAVKRRGATVEQAFKVLDTANL